MANDETTDDTHRVRGSTHYRSTRGGTERFEPGETLTPTEGELDTLPDRFEPLDSAAPRGTTQDAAESVENDADTDTGEDTDEAESEQDADDTADTDTLTVEAVENAEYNELRGFAREFDGVNGNWGTDRLRAELLDRVSED